MTIDEVIERLRRWSMANGDFHADRELADAVLIADGWQCEPDPSFAGGVRWWIGVSPQYSTGEATRPHPINDLNAAIGVVPLRHNWRLTVIGDSAAAYVGASGELPHDKHYGLSERPSVALLIAALKAKKALAP
jgi:hypothetical protein